jgi:hypothetical protein
LNPVGAIIVACFAVLWVAAGANQLGRWFLPLLTIAILISAGIVIAATKIPFGAHSGGFDGKIYGIFVTLEVVAIALAVILLKRCNAKQYILPVIAFIVGAHFFGMVPALQSNDFWFVGGAMCVLAIVAMSMLPERIWAPVVGIGCALILWLSALGAFF